MTVIISLIIPSFVQDPCFQINPQTHFGAAAEPSSALIPLLSGPRSVSSSRTSTSLEPLHKEENEVLGDRRGRGSVSQWQRLPCRLCPRSTARARTKRGASATAQTRRSPETKTKNRTKPHCFPPLHAKACSDLPLPVSFRDVRCLIHRCCSSVLVHFPSCLLPQIMAPLDPGSCWRYFNFLVL